MYGSRLGGPALAGSPCHRLVDARWMEWADDGRLDRHQPALAVALDRSLVRSPLRPWNPARPVWLGTLGSVEERFAMALLSDGVCGAGLYTDHSHGGDRPRRGGWAVESLETPALGIPSRCGAGDRRIGLAGLAQPNCRRQ
jgi:hypothetical protein